MAQRTRITCRQGSKSERSLIWAIYIFFDGNESTFHVPKTGRNRHSQSYNRRRCARFVQNLLKSKTSETEFVSVCKRFCAIDEHDFYFPSKCAIELGSFETKFEDALIFNLHACLKTQHFWCKIRRAIYLYIGVKQNKCSNFQHSLIESN